MMMHSLHVPLLDAVAMARGTIVNNTEKRQMSAIVEFTDGV